MILWRDQGLRGCSESSILYMEEKTGVDREEEEKERERSKENMRTHTEEVRIETRMRCEDREVYVKHTY